MAKNNDKLTDVQTAALRKIAQVIAKEKVRIENEPHLQELAAERGVPLVATTWANEMTITGVYRIRRATLEVLETKGYVERRWSDGQGRQVRPTAKAASIIDPAPAPVAEATPAPAPVVPPAPVAEATPAPTGDPVKTTRTFTHDLRGGVVMTSDAYTTDGLQRLEDEGVTDVIVGFRWPYHTGPDPQPLAEKLGNLRRYADEVIAKMNP